MDSITIVIIAVGLAMDAFVVSIVSGSAYRQLHVRHALRMALFFRGLPGYNAANRLSGRPDLERAHSTFRSLDCFRDFWPGSAEK